MGCHFLLQGIFLTQELNPGLLHCRKIVYHLIHQLTSSRRQAMDNVFNNVWISSEKVSSFKCEFTFLGRGGLNLRNLGPVVYIPKDYKWLEIWRFSPLSEGERTAVPLPCKLQIHNFSVPLLWCKKPICMC